MGHLTADALDHGIDGRTVGPGGVRRVDPIFEVMLDAARKAGLVSAKQVFHSTPLYGAVASQGTVTMIRSASVELDDSVCDAAGLSAAVLGQDLEAGEDGRFRIARKLGADRVISALDPEARHGRKNQHRGLDCFKGHITIDPDSELVTATTVPRPATAAMLPSPSTVRATGDGRGGPGHGAPSRDTHSTRAT